MIWPVAMKITSINIVRFALLICMAILAGSQISFASPATDYEYEVKDRAAEQKKYLERLAQDKKKVELAIRSTKVLIDKSRNKPYLPEIYLRLAELYIEKSRIVYYLRKGEQNEKLTALEQFESNLLKNQAIEIYQRILSHFPDFQDLDKVRFFMAHEYRELGKMEEMVTQYRAIIKEHGQSSYVPEAYLLLGDYYFNQHDVEKAKRHYEAVQPYPGSQAVAIARYKLAWCHINNADFKKAITLFEEAVISNEPGKNLDIDTYRRVDVKLESLIDMAFCYPEQYKKSSPEDALAYFKKYSWSRQTFTIVIEKLAFRYFIKKRWKMAATLYRKLAELRQDPEKLLEYSRNIFECVRALGTFEDADRDVALIVKALGKQKYSVHIDEDKKQKNIKDFEVYARDIVTHLHEKARTAKSSKDFNRAADAYALYLGFFHDSPVVGQMRANYAEALFSAKHYFEAGKQYEQLVPEITVDRKKRKDTLYSALTSYYHALKNKTDLNHYQTAYARDGMRTTGHQYAEDFPSSIHTKDVLFNVAWVSFDAGKHDQAITEFTEFVDRYPGTKEAEAAIHLVLDAFHMMEDFEGMTTFGKHIIANQKITDAKFKLEVAQIVANAEKRIVSALTLAAVDDWDTGKAGLMQMAKESKSTAMGEQALNALVVSSMEKKDLETLFAAGENLINQFPNSERVEDTMGLLIESSLKIGQYRLLATYMEQFAAKMPNHANTMAFLRQAGHIRQRLGQYEKANADFRRYLSMSPQNKSEREDVVFAMAHNLEKNNRSQTAAEILQEHYSTLSGTGKIKADAKIATLSFQQKKHKDAYQYFNRARKAFKPSFGEKDPLLSDAIAKMAFDDVFMAAQKYMDLKLSDTIDNRLVTEKAKLLAELEQDYQEVMKYKAPEWALKSCFELAKINNEFARFLKEAPLPQLSVEEQKEYVDLIDKKAAGYLQKAEKYLQTSIKLAHKWELCRPDLAGYYHSHLSLSGKADTFSVFAGTAGRSGREISSGSFKDIRFKDLYGRLLEQPEDAPTVLGLSEAYMQKGDFSQAALAARSGLGKTTDDKDPVKAKLNNILGVIHLYLGEDQLAKERFKKALAIDQRCIAAQVNLAGLLKHYGHNSKAESMMMELADSQAVEKSKDPIHPRAGEFYYESRQVSEEKLENHPDAGGSSSSNLSAELRRGR